MKGDCLNLGSLPTLHYHVHLTNLQAQVYFDYVFHLLEIKFLDLVKIEKSQMDFGMDQSLLDLQNVLLL